MAATARRRCASGDRRRWMSLSLEGCTGSSLLWRARARALSEGGTRGYCETWLEPSTFPTLWMSLARLSTSLPRVVTRPDQKSGDSVGRLLAIARHEDDPERLTELRPSVPTLGRLPPLRQRTS